MTRPTSPWGCRATDLDALSARLLALYDGAQSSSLVEFGAVLFGWLATQIAFDSGATGTMSYYPEGVGYQAFRLHGQPVEKVLDYPPISNLDIAAKAMVRNVGSASIFSVSHDLQSQSRNIPMRRYAERFGVAESLAFCTREGRVGDAFVLWRGSRRKRFQAVDAKRAEALAPHLFLALQINSFRAIGPERRTDVVEAALVADRFGCITAGDPMAFEWLALEWPQWAPPLLPRPLIEAFRSTGPCNHLGRRVWASGGRTGDLLVVRIRLAPGGSVLTPAENRMAARLTRAGTYKEIAREIGISPATVRNHVHAVYAKLGVSTRAGLVDAWPHREVGRADALA